MDHMMPGMDGLEATRRIRALATSTADAAAATSVADATYYEKLPIVALSANAVQGARDLFLKAGMNDFLPKPIEDAALNAVLAKWLPEGKRAREQEAEGGSSAPPAGDALLDELAAIPGLDVGEGLAHIGGSRADYYRVLRQFCANLDEGLAAIKADLEKSDWKEYGIRLHAYKGVFAIMGQKQLSEWAGKLEFAGKELSEKGAATIIGNETVPIIEAMTAFRDALRATSLLPKYGAAKTKIDRPGLAEKLRELSEACAAYKGSDANRLADELEKLSVDEKTDAALEGICAKVLSLDYEDVVTAIEAFKI
jgi:HPt (histidine-containing phosphotransfer) domain-containing protein